MKTREEAASEGFEQYLDKISNNRLIQINRIDLHKQTWQAAKLSVQKEIAEKEKQLQEAKDLVRELVKIAEWYGDHIGKQNADKIKSLLGEK